MVFIILIIIITVIELFYYPNILQNLPKIFHLQGSTLVLAPLPRASRISKLLVKGKWKLHLANACPTGQVRCIYFRFTFENVCRFCGLSSKLVLENMLSHATTMFYSVLNETWKRFFWRAGESWSRASENWISLALLGKSPQKLMSCPDLYEYHIGCSEYEFIPVAW